MNDVPSAHASPAPLPALPDEAPSPSPVEKAEEVRVRMEALVARLGREPSRTES